MAPMNDKEDGGDEEEQQLNEPEQEAMEKARELKQKADEEFSIEKIVRQETIKIDSQFDTKRKQAEIQKKILLEKRESLLGEVCEVAREKVASISSDKEKYEQLLKGLILQGLFTMMEKDIKVVCRKTDAETVQKASDAAKEEFNEKAGFPVTIDVIQELSDESNGGISLVGYGSRITVDNTLDERLRILEDKALPLLRVELFGPNPSRRFFT